MKPDLDELERLALEATPGTGEESLCYQVGGFCFLLNNKSFNTTSATATAGLECGRCMSRGRQARPPRPGR